MDAANCSLACGLVSGSYVNQGAAALSARRRLIKALLSNRSLPAEGWDEATIEMLLQDAALMDSNTFPGQVGLGEREGRVACPLVARRHGLLAHGIGRSGDITAEQPKAAGSSLLAKLCGSLAADALRLAGLQDQGPPVVLPCATGMTLTLVLLAAAAATPPQPPPPPPPPAEASAEASAEQAEDGQKQQQQQQQRRRYVVWSRIDQKTCLKSITAANLEPVVVELLSQGDELVTDVEGIRAAVMRLGADSVAAVVTTTSCFAPRSSDDVVAVAKLCASLGVTHAINNAYGVQSAAIMKALTTACRRGRVDAIVQSTDKNFMVPVGGAIVTAPAGKSRGWLVDAVAKGYPGRAAMTPLLDLLTTLLYWGAAGWREKLQQREELYDYLKEKLSAAALSLSERLLVTPGNPISLAMTLDGLATAAAAVNSSSGGSSSNNGSSSSKNGPQGSAGVQKAGVSFFGSMLWARNVSGTRVLSTGKQQVIGGITFQDYGCHMAGYPHPYLNAAAALGGSKQEVDVFVGRLVRTYQELREKWTGQAAAAAGAAAAAAAAAPAAAAAAPYDAPAPAG